MHAIRRREDWRNQIGLLEATPSGHLTIETRRFQSGESDPTKVLARAQEPIFEPVYDWEKNGQVPNVVFVEGLVRDGKRWLFYYGGADKYVGVASAAVR